MVRYVLLLQKFDIEIRVKKGVENLVADYLLKLPDEVQGRDREGIREKIPNEHLLLMTSIMTPWYANILKYLVSGYVYLEFKSQQRKKTLSWLKELLLGRVSPDEEVWWPIYKNMCWLSKGAPDLNQHATMHPMEGILKEPTLLLRLLNQVMFTLPYSMMLMNWLKLVIYAKGYGIFPQGNKFHSPIF